MAATHRRVGQVEQQRVRLPVGELGVDRLHRLAEGRLGGRRPERRDDDRLDQRPGVDELAGAAVDDPVDDRLGDRQPGALVESAVFGRSREIVGVEELLPGVEEKAADQGEERAEDGEYDRGPAAANVLRLCSPTADDSTSAARERALYLCRRGRTRPLRACDICVVGGGIVGVAAARELKRRHPDARACVVLERERELATHQSGHSSGVIHAGIYYAPGSLKARLCVEGARRLYEYCAERGIDARSATAR